MSPSDPTRTPLSGPRPSPEDEDRLLDALRGELAARDQHDVAVRLAADPALAEASRRLERFLSTVREAHEPAPDGVAAQRIALRVRDQVGAEEARIRREAPGATRRLAWGRILAVSVAAHVVVLGVLAFLVQQEPRAERAPPDVHAVLPFPGLEPEEFVWEDIPAVWRGPDREPRIPEEGPLGLGVAGVEDADLDLAPLQEGLRDHPRPVALSMVIRRSDALKRRQLTRYGMDASGTLRVVKRGLDALEGRRRADGSFPAGGGRSTIGQTALALLPFLADGESSRTGDRAERVVAHGIAWLRGRVFGDDLVGPRATVEGEVPIAELGMALRALSEDYMLSYGHLAPGEAARRATELGALARKVEDAQRPDGSFPGSADDVRAAVWPMWGLEAVVRTGAVEAPEEVPLRFRRWYVASDRSDPTFAAAGLLLHRELGEDFLPEARRHATRLLLDADASEADPFLALMAGTGLLLHDAEAFRAWNEELGERLLDALDARGMVRKGDEVGGTALHLLALQAAYRTF